MKIGNIKIKTNLLPTSFFYKIDQKILLKNRINHTTLGKMQIWGSLIKDFRVKDTGSKKLKTPLLPYTKNYKVFQEAYKNKKNNQYN